MPGERPLDLGCPGPVHGLQLRDFERIRAAFETALELPRWCPAHITVGVRGADGRLAATGVFLDRRHARLFEIQMGGLGYRAAAPEAQDATGCDVVYGPKPAAMAEARR